MNSKNKNAQEENFQLNKEISNLNFIGKQNKAQEEMVGFALIIIIVSVILLVFLSLSSNNQQKDEVESFEVESFVQSFLQYTSSCRDNLEFLSVQELIYDCNNNRECLNGEKSCDVLGTTLKGITEESWKIEGNRPVKGYELIIDSSGGNIVNITEGNLTISSKGAIQTLPNRIKITFKAYY